MAALTLLQPDLGNSLALVILTLALAYLAGARVQHMALIAGAALPVVVALIALKPYRWRRMVAFMNPWDDPAGQRVPDHPVVPRAGLGRLARASGSATPSRSSSTCPSRTPTSSSPSSARSSGSLGAAVIVALFALLIWRGLRIGLRAPDAFGAFLGLGLTIMLATQTIVNLGVVTGALPTKGLPLPFISFGGSALLMTMFSAGRAVEHLAARESGSSVQEVPAHPLRGHRRRRHERHRRGAAHPRLPGHRLRRPAQRDGGAARAAGGEGLRRPRGGATSRARTWWSTPRRWRATTSRSRRRVSAASR